MKKLLAVLAVILLLIVPVQLVYAASAGQIEDVAKEFICNCGCNKLLPNCDMSCGNDLRGVIGKKIDAGWDKEKIIDYMFKNYNEAILAAPTKKGFNLTAWITPFAVMGLAGIGIYFIITAWVNAGKKEVLEKAADVAAETAKDKKISEEYQKKLDDELKDFDW